MSEQDILEAIIRFNSDLKFDDNVIELFKQNFQSLNTDQANQVIDAKFKLLGYDLLTEDDIHIMFEQLDKLKRYDDMMFLAASKPNHIYNIYVSSNWNIFKNWDGTINDTKFTNKEGIMSDLLMNHFDNRFFGTKLASIIHKKVFNNKNTKKLYKLYNQLNSSEILLG
jgi:hypothetical protein